MNPASAFFLNPKVIRTIAIVIGLIIAGIILWRVFKWLSRRVKTGGQRQETSDITFRILQLRQQGMKPSYSPDQYSSWANQLQEAFDGCGTSNHVWENVFNSVKNELDLLLVMDSYNTRTIDECGPFTGNFTGTLSETIVSDLSGSEISEINAKLKAKGINKTF